MKFIYRLGFYLGGFTIGIIILFFILGGKKTSCDYGPEARTLKNIRIKSRGFSEKSLTFLKKENLDTSVVSILLRNGDVLFSESNTKLDSCKQYMIVGIVSNKKLKMKIENCEIQATIIEFVSFETN